MTDSRPDPSTGYRLLDVGEATRDGDLVWSGIAGAWLPIVPPTHGAARESVHYARLSTATGRLIDKIAGGVLLVHIERPDQHQGETHVRLAASVPPELREAAGTFGLATDGDDPEATATLFDSLAYWLRIDAEAAAMPDGTRFWTEHAHIGACATA